MASYTELRGIFNDSELRNRVVMSTVIEAYSLLGQTPSADDRAWISAVFANPEEEGKKVYMAVLASNAALTLNSIQGASDAAIQAQVTAVVPQLVLANAGV